MCADHLSIMDMTADAILAAGQPFLAESQLLMSHVELPFYNVITVVCPICTKLAMA